ncbi:MAG: EcoRV family type II restriction endonuclease [Chloroflexi bacterium]|nr:EcoRV family type II restriction endonuclease [Chloroflexota bacterium]
MDKITFLNALQIQVADFNRAVSTEKGDWIVKGFIDIAKNIYTISVDTKVISKIMELLLFPELVRFAETNALKLVLAEQQNFYPDISFVDDEEHRFALDIKSTYRVNANEVNGMTLGAFTGYFRNRQSSKNISFPYASYSGHFVLGSIYSKTEAQIDERRKYRLDELESITSVVNHFEFFVQEKWRIAAERPGSGNTKNIGSVTAITKLVSGAGPFAELGEHVFDDYWQFYLTEDMARAIESKRPYTNLASYLKYKGRRANKRKSE